MMKDFDFDPLAWTVGVIAVCILLGIVIRGCQDNTRAIAEACLKLNPAWQCKLGM
jgi:hypothetical protein